MPRLGKSVRSLQGYAQPRQEAFDGARPRALPRALGLRPVDAISRRYSHDYAATLSQAILRTAYD